MEFMKRIGIVLITFLTGAVLLACSEKSDNNYTPPVIPKASPSPGKALPGMSYGKEIAMLKDIVGREPDNLNAWIKLGNLSMDSNRYEDAIMAYQNALRLDPGNTDVRVDMGTCYRRTGNPQKALEMFRKTIEMDSKHLYAHRNAGVVLAFDLKQYDEAITEFETYLKLAPNASDAAQISGIINELRTRKQSR